MTEELFETCDRQGNASARLVPRSEVHRRGLWHKSANVFLFTPGGALHVQRRAAAKDLYAGLWDYSVGEHLKPGESYRDAALRGLQEELGVTPSALETLGAVRAVEIVDGAAGFRDRELQQTFRGTWSGPVRPNPLEVDEVRLLDLARLRAWTASEPHAFTPQLLAALRDLELG